MILTLQAFMEILKESNLKQYDHIAVNENNDSLYVKKEYIGEYCESTKREIDTEIVE